MANITLPMPHIVPEETVEFDGRKLTIRRRTLPHYIAALHWARRSGITGLSSCKSAKDWNGNVTNAAYEKMLTQGWPEGVEGAEGLDGLASDACERLQFVRDVGGAFPLVPAYLAGAPDNMLMPRENPVEHQRGVTLIIDASFHCGVRGHDVLKYAQTVMKLVAWLEAERIETAVYAVHTAVYDGYGESAGRVMHITPIREAGQIIQPERLASIVHPAFLRRAQFAMLEYECHELGKHGGHVPWGYGTPSHASIAELQHVLPESYSVIALPKVGDGDPTKAVEETLNLKLRRED